MFLPEIPQITPATTPKKLTPEVEPEEPHTKTTDAWDLYREPFKSRLTYGIKDKDGEWIMLNLDKDFAYKMFDKYPEAVQLVNGCNPFAEEGDVLTYTTVKERASVAVSEAVRGTGIPGDGSRNAAPESTPPTGEVEPSDGK